MKWMLNLLVACALLCMGWVDNHRDKVARTVVAGALIIGGALVLYEVLKPSEYNQGQVVLTRF